VNKKENLQEEMKNKEVAFRSIILYVRSLLCATTCQIGVRKVGLREFFYLF
jgi:hypothetical protein